jgi:hypothetical protein
MHPTSLGVTWSVRGLASLAAHPAPPFTLAGDTRSVRQAEEGYQMKQSAWVLLWILATAVCALGNPVEEPIEGVRPLDYCSWTEWADAPAQLTWDEHEFTGSIRFDMKKGTLFVNDTSVPILVDREIVEDRLATPADLHAYADFFGEDLGTWIGIYRESPLVDSLWSSGDTLHVLVDAGEGFLPTWQMLVFREGAIPRQCKDLRTMVLAISERLGEGHDVSVVNGVVHLAGASTGSQAQSGSLPN